MASVRPRRHASAYSVLATLLAAAVLAVVIAPPTTGALSLGTPPDATAVPTGPVAGIHVPAVDGEIVALRTRTSRTFATDGGAYEARVYAGAVNYLDAKGAWQPIDTTLVRTKTGYRTKANSVVAELPLTADGTVRVSKGNTWLAYTLRGAGRTAAEVQGNAVVYRGALPATAVEVRSEAEQVKELLVLDSAAATSTFVYDVQTSAGLIPKVNGQSVDFVNALGKAEASFAPPWMKDANDTMSTALSYSVGRSLTGWTVSLSLDRAWLADPGRAWPVTVDPTSRIEYAAQNTYVDQANPTTNYAGGTTLKAGMAADGVNRLRTLLQFEVATAVPKDAHVLSARLRAVPRTTASSSIGVYQVSRTWSNAASWNTYNGTSNWTSAGGDTTGSSHWVTTSFTSGTSASWYLQPLVKGWVDGSIANNGVMLRHTSETGSTQAITFDSSTGTEPVRLDLNYTPRTGIRPFYTYDTRALTGRSSMRVNVANGNLVVANDDISIKGTGLDLKVGRYYNSRSDTPITPGPFPVKWSLSPGRDLRLDKYADGVMLTGASDYKGWFQTQSGVLKTPPGENADLVKNADNTYTLTYRKSGVKYFFNTDGLLTKQKDRNDNEITFTYANPAVKDTQITSITDTQGRSVTFTYTGGKLTRIQDPTGRQWDYGYDPTYTYLTKYTDPGDGTVRGETLYAYNAAGLLWQITDPEGEITQLTYDALSRVKTIKHITDDPNDADPVTEYTYNDGETLVEDANDHTTKHYYDKDSRVERTENPLGDTARKGYNTNSDVTSTTAGGTSAPGTGDTLTNDYDPATGNLTKSTLPTTAATELDYSSPGSATQYVPAGSKDAQGNHTTYAYDARNNVKSATDDTSTNRVRFERQGDGTTTCGAKPGQVCKMIDPKDKETTYSYDSLGRMTGVDPPDPLGSQSFTYDTLSRVKTITDGRNNVTTNTYDPLDRVTKVQVTSASDVVLTYDKNDNLAQRVDDTGTTTYQYDERNRLKEQAMPGNLVVTYAYDKVGNLISYTDATGTTTYAYDSANQMKELTEPGGTCTGTPKLKCTTYTYNRKGQRATVLYPNHVEMRLTYDASGRQTEILTSNLTGELLKYGYDYKKGTADSAMRHSMTDPDGNKTVYTYDSENRLKKASAYVERMQADGPVAWYRLGEDTGTTTAADSSGNGVDGTYSLTGITRKVNGAIAGETNQAAGFDGLTGVVNVPDQSSLRLNGNFSIEFWAKLTQFTNSYPGILRKGDSYTGKTGYLVWYESNGNVRFKRNGQDSFGTGAGSLVTDRYRHFAITYDGLSLKMFVDGVQKSSTAATFATNIETGALQIGKGDSTNYGKQGIDEVALYNKALTPSDVKRHASAGHLGAAYDYDKAGNRTKQNDTFSRGVGATANELTYAHNDASQVTSRSGNSGYSYDGNGNETAGLGQYTRSSTVYNTRNQATSFTTSNGSLSNTYAGTSQSERYTSGGLTFENSNLLGITAARNGGNGTATYYTRDPSGALHSMHLGSSPNAATYYYVFDGQGSVVGLTDATGALVNKYTYDPYGIPLSATEAVTNPFRYIAGYRDITGLTKFGMRYYDQHMGRFTQLDPTGKDRTYLYAGNNPVNNADPSGGEYFDLNVSFSAFGLSVNVGVMWGDKGVAPYAGFGIGGPGGGSVSLTRSDQDISGGWQYAGQACFGGCVAGGADLTGEGKYTEVGFGAGGGGSLMMNFVFGPY